MATDSFKQVLINEGEGVAFTDLNDFQRFSQSQFYDQFLASQIPNLGGSTVNSIDPEYGAQNSQGLGYNWGPQVTGRAFCTNPGQAFLRPGSANNKVQISAGTLWQLVSTSITGSDAQFIPFKFTGNEEFTIADWFGVTGGSTQPIPIWWGRVDLLQMKLEYITDTSETRHFNDEATGLNTSTTYTKRRRVQCTLSVKQGVPAEASGQVPDPDPGYCAIGSVAIAAPWTSASAIQFNNDWSRATNVANCHDQRMPFRVKAYYVDPNKFKRNLNWNLGDNNSTISSTNSNNQAFALCPAPMGRIVAIGVHHQLSSGSILTLRVTSNIADENFGNGNKVFGLSTWTSSGSNVLRYEVMPFQAFSYLPPAFSPGGFNIPTSTTCKLSPPLWANGSPGPREDMRNMSAPKDNKRAGVEILTSQSGDKIGHIVFYVAEGL